MNCWVKRKLILGYRDSIILRVGEGPWRKVYRDPRITPLVRKKIVEELRKTWAPQVRVFAEITVRRPRRFDEDNVAGGMKPLWDGLQWAGWCVNDHVKWLSRDIRDEVLGDHKTVLQLQIPETKAELESMNAKRAKP